MRRLVVLTALVAIGFSSAALAQNSKSGIVGRRSLGTVLPEVKFQGATLKDCFEFLRDVTSANIHVNWRALEAAGIGQDTQVNIRLREVTLRKVLNTILSEAGAGVGLTYYTADGVIEVTTAELADKEMITKVYPVDDLLMEIPDFSDAPDFSLQTSSSNSGSGGGSRGGGSRGGGGGGGGGGLFGGGGGGNQGGTTEKTTTKAERAEALVTLIRETVRPDIWRENGGVASIRYYNGHLVVTAPRSVHEAIGGPVE